MNTNSNTTNKFIEGLKGELDSKTMFTENGALAYQTAGGEGKCLVDFNFAISAMRGWDETKIADAYAKAYYESDAMPVWTGAAIIPRKVYDKMGGFPLGIKLGEDFLLWSKIALRYPVTFLNEPLAYYNNDLPVNLRATRNLHHPNNHMLFHHLP